MLDKKTHTTKFDFDDKSIEVNVKKSSFAVRAKVLQIQAVYREKKKELDKKNPVTAEMFEKIQKIQTENPDLSQTELDSKLVADFNIASLQELNEKSEIYNDEINLWRSKLNLAIARVIHDIRDLTTEQKSQFNSEIDSDFWENTDMEEIEEAVAFFRDRDRI